MLQEMPLAKAVFQIQLDPSGRCRRGTSNLCNAELNAAGNIYPNTMLAAAIWCLNRPASRGKNVTNLDLRRAFFYGSLEVDWQIERVMNLVAHGTKHPPMCRLFLSLLALKYPSQRITLRIGRAGVNDDLHFPLALKDRPGPGVKQRRLCAGQVDITEVSVCYFQNFKAATISVRRPFLELTRARVAAIAVSKAGSFYILIRKCHNRFL